MDRPQFPLNHSEIFRVMVDRSPLPVSIQDSNWQFVFANQAYCDYVGYAFDELIGRDPSTFLFPSEGLPDSHFHRQWAQGRSQEEFSQPGKSENSYGAMVADCVFRADMGHSQTPTGEDLWCGVLFDLTEIDQLQAELYEFEGRARVMQTRFDSFAELSNEGMLIVNAQNGSVMHANTVVGEITGVALTGHGQGLDALLANVDADDRGRIQQMLARGGSPRGLELSVVLEHPVSGRRSIRVRSFRSPHPKSEIFVLMEDVTDQIRHEENRLTVEVFHREAVIREIHHRVNNQLQGVMNLLEVPVDASDATRNAVEMAAGRINAIASLNGLLTRHSAEVPIVQLVVQIVSHAEQALGSHVRIDLAHAQPDLKGVSIDTNGVAVALVINDLLMQACKFSGDDTVCIDLQSTVNAFMIQFSFSVDNADKFNLQADPSRFTLAKSLLHGTDSNIESSQNQDQAMIALKLGAQTLSGAIYSTV